MANIKINELVYAETLAAEDLGSLLGGSFSSPDAGVKEDEEGRGCTEPKFPPQFPTPDEYPIIRL